MLKDYRLPPLQGGSPKHAIVFLHGVGDRGDGGLLSIGELWQPSLPNCAFFCPDAPFPYDMAPADFGGRQWFSLKSFEPAALEKGVAIAAPLLNEYLDELLKTHKLLPHQLTLVGFSQGTMMALYVAPRREQPVACVVGYSGALIGGDKLSQTKRSTMPILLIHGTHDEVVPFAAMSFAAAQLKAAQFPVKTQAVAAAHTIDNVGVAEGLRFIKATTQC